MRGRGDEDSGPSRHCSQPYRTPAYKIPRKLFTATFVYRFVDSPLAATRFFSPTKKPYRERAWTPREQRVVEATTTTTRVGVSNPSLLLIGLIPHLKRVGRVERGIAAG